MKVSEWLWTGIVTAITAVIVIVTMSRQSHPVHGLVGTDVSWPNCGIQRPVADFGIVGVTGGLDFQPNPCVTTEATWFSNLALYMNTGWPGPDFHLQFQNSPQHCVPHAPDCLAYNYGYHASDYALAYAHSRLIHSSQWWLDVETENSWTADMQQNRSALQGMIDAIKHADPSATIGFYSYPGQWMQIVGDWHPKLTAWAATGSLEKSAAQEACSARSFTAGSLTLTQYTQQLDKDYVC